MEDVLNFRGKDCKPKSVIWSLFSGSGLDAVPWAEAGHEVYCFNADEADHGEYVVKCKHPNIHYINIWIDKNFHNHMFDMQIPVPDIIFAYPSCTHTANCGSKHEKTEEQKMETVELAKYVEWLGDYYHCPWMVENPVGSLSTLWRKPNFYFDPYEYGGYLTGEEEQFHPKMPRRDGYTKKTAIWCGNGFKRPEKLPVEHIGYFWAWKSLGGKSARTKQLRSLTPRGWAKAVMLANS